MGFSLWIIILSNFRLSCLLYYAGVRYYHGDFVRYTENGITYAGRIRRIFVNETRPHPHPLQLGVEPLLSFDDLPKAIQRLCSPSKRLLYSYEKVLVEI